MLAMHVVAGCQALAGVEDTRIFPDSGQVVSYAIEGVAAGVLQPLGLRLLYTGGSEVLSIDRDGPFTFATRLVDGDTYAVELVGPNPCSIAGNIGIIAGASPNIGISCMLVDIDIPGPVVTGLNFLPTKNQYNIEISRLQQTVAVTATAARSGLDITIAGAAATSGVASDPIALAPGDNAIAVAVAHPASGWQRVYDIAVSRSYGISQYAYVKGIDVGVGDIFGSSVAVWGDWLAVGAREKNGVAAGSGEVYILRREGTAWVEDAHFVASNTGAADHFGSSVALWGDILAVGASGEDSTATGVGGDGVALWGDALAVGAPVQDGSGAVSVFRRVGLVWAEEAYVHATNAAASDRFGADVALWGDTLAVGAYYEDSTITGPEGEQLGGSNSGAVYIFRRSGTTWAQAEHIKASNAGLNDSFGSNVALCEHTLAIGATGEDSNATGIGGDESDNSANDSGAVYVIH